MSGHLLSHSNSFGFEMGKDAAGCRALNRNYYCRRCSFTFSLFLLLLCVLHPYKSNIGGTQLC